MPTILHHLLSAQAGRHGFRCQQVVTDVSAFWLARFSKKRQMRSPSATLQGNHRVRLAGSLVQSMAVATSGCRHRLFDRHRQCDAYLGRLPLPVQAFVSGKNAHNEHVDIIGDLM